MKTRSLILILSFFLLGLLNTATPAQLDRIENKLPKSVPLKVEFKNYNKVDWWHDLELQVTNTGNKPIYYVWLILWLDVKNKDGKQHAISFKFGDNGKFYPANTDDLATSDDAAILPGKSYTFKVDASSVKFWDLLKSEESFVRPSEAVLDHGFTSFGDGSGLEAGGSPVKKKNSEPLLNGRRSASSFRNIFLSYSFFSYLANPSSNGCSRGSDNNPRSPSFGELLFEVGPTDSDLSCIECTAGRCPAPPGYETQPAWVKRSLFQNCQNCNENPNRLVNWYDYGGGCYDPTNSCYWFRQVEISCPTAGSPRNPGRAMNISCSSARSRIVSIKTAMGFLCNRPSVIRGRSTVTITRKAENIRILA